MKFEYNTRDLWLLRIKPLHANKFSNGKKSVYDITSVLTVQMKWSK